jgi:hypothetical protein
VRFRSEARDVLVNMIAQVIWVVLVAVSALGLFVVFGTTSMPAALASDVSAPAWVIGLASLAAMGAGVFVFFLTRKASAVRGRMDATKANLELFQERAKVDHNARVIRSTRFGRWPLGEILEFRSTFRQELDAAIMSEGADVRRIWNITSVDDIDRLESMLEKYAGKTNHSIRAYVGIPDHVLPEVLVVDGRGATLSFTSPRNPYGLDWMIRFRRKDLQLVVRDYFDVLWDRAERVLDSGERTRAGAELLRRTRDQLKVVEPPAQPGEADKSHLPSSQRKGEDG